MITDFDILASFFLWSQKLAIKSTVVGFYPRPICASSQSLQLSQYLTNFESLEQPLNIKLSRRDGLTPSRGCWDNNGWLWRSCCCCRSCPCCCCVAVVRLPFAVLRSNNYSIDPILWSVLYQTISFRHPCICQSFSITKPHPPTRFYCPLQCWISKNVVFIPKLTFFYRFSPVFRP